MNVDAYKKKITLSRIACFIALQCALSIHNTALAREYFNPAFLGIDGPGKDLTDLSAFEEGIYQIPETIMLTLSSIKHQSVYMILTL